MDFTTKQPKNEEFIRTVNISFLGGLCGKSCIIDRFDLGSFPEIRLATLGLDMRSKIIVKDGKN